ncbi:MAG: iron ABC transporter permease [Candidatus Accumulibacter sp.]|jgi:iron complex transport system permease protein|nr:iron ABC transporter permease [Accumulibacter sp.]
MNARLRVAYATLFAALVVLACFAILNGSVRITPAQFVGILDGTERGAVAEIVLGLRLPRLVMSLLIGIMLAMSGTISQAVFHNPLADPYIIGVSAGAAAGAALAFLFKLPDFYYGIFGFVTALSTSLLVFRISGRRGQTDTASLLITGIAIAAFFAAFTSFAMYAAGEDSYRVMVWMMGYLGYATWPRIAILSVPLLLSAVYFIYRRHDIDALLLGDAEAFSLGLSPGRLKRRLLIIVCCITAFSVAFCGMIGFVGLIIPHAARLCIGNIHGRLLPFAAFFGGVFLLFADTVARTALAPIETPVGIVTAFFGAPFFLFLAARKECH